MVRFEGGCGLFSHRSPASMTGLDGIVNVNGTCGTPSRAYDIMRAVIVRAYNNILIVYHTFS